MEQKKDKCNRCKFVVTFNLQDSTFQCKLLDYHQSFESTVLPSNCYLQKEIEKV